MKIVIDSFLHNGILFTAGAEVADDPSLTWAEKRGLIVETEPKAEKEPEKKQAAKKTTAKKK